MRVWPGVCLCERMDAYIRTYVCRCACVGWCACVCVCGCTYQPFTQWPKWENNCKLTTRDDQLTTCAPLATACSGQWIGCLSHYIYIYTISVTFNVHCTSYSLPYIKPYIYIRCVYGLVLSILYIEIYIINKYIKSHINSTNIRYW